MQKKLVKHGNSAALVIEKPILELLGAGINTVFDVMTDGETLILTPVRTPEEQQAFQDAVQAGNGRYARALKKLAE